MYAYYVKNKDKARGYVAYVYSFLKDMRSLRFSILAIRYKL